MATNNMDHASSNADNYEDGFFEREHDKFFRVEIPTSQVGTFRYFFYMECNFPQLGVHRATSSGSSAPPWTV